MEKNVGGWDRTARLILGALLVIVGIAGYAGVLRVATMVPQALTSIILVLVGLVVLATGVLQKCQVNRLLNRDTYRR